MEGKQMLHYILIIALFVVSKSAFGLPPNPDAGLGIIKKDVTPIYGETDDATLDNVFELDSTETSYTDAEGDPVTTTIAPTTTSSGAAVSITTGNSTINSTTTPITSSSSAEITTSNTTKDPSPSPSSTTTSSLVTPSTTQSTAPPPPRDTGRKFDGLSFIGGMILASGLGALTFLAVRHLRRRNDSLPYANLR